MGDWGGIGWDMGTLALRERVYVAGFVRDHRVKDAETDLVKLLIVIVCFSVIAASIGVTIGWLLHGKDNDDDFD